MSCLLGLGLGLNKAGGAPRASKDDAPIALGELEELMDAMLHFMGEVVPVKKSGMSQS